MTLTWFGIREWGSALLAMLLIWSGCYWLIEKMYWVQTGWWIAGIAFFCFLCIAFFFRNPFRQIPGNRLLLASPADGVIKDISTVEDFNQPPFTGKALRIGIVPAFLDVRLNRAPAQLTVKEVRYRPGKHLDAGDSGAAEENEAMTISGTAEINGETFPLAVRQISGSPAGRIVCPVESGAVIKRGAVYGMVRSGSRIELYLPPDDFEISAAVGDHVRGGESIVATFIR